jgi:hypothetical protein
MTIASDNVYDRVNDYGAVRISLAGPNDIRSWSFGEVKKPETSAPAASTREPSTRASSATDAASR